MLDMQWHMFSAYDKILFNLNLNAQLIITVVYIVCMYTCTLSVLEKTCLGEKKKKPNLFNHTSTSLLIIPLFLSFPTPRCLTVTELLQTGKEKVRKQTLL